MIKTEKSKTKCRCCGEQYEVFEIKFAFNGSPTSNFVPLCKNCRKELVEKVKEIDGKEI